MSLSRRTGEKSVPGLYGVRKGGSHGMPVALGGPCVGVTGEVGDLSKSSS